MLLRSAQQSKTQIESITQFQALFKERIEESIAAKQRLLSYTEVCAEVAERIIGAIRSGHKLLFFGNGGSAADAQHLAAEFVGRYYLDRPALPAQALTVNPSALTAIGNDYSFDLVFSRQIEAFGQAGDVAIGLSTSGNSRNVVEALRAANKREMLTIAMTGEHGGLLKREADYCLCVPSTDTPRIQEAHMLIGHILSELVERAIFAGTNGS
ncbi:MAG TPA: D-sedoheptulose 7-phosphate isomerase [Ktedonobacteraceae bacterium]|jgi:D-sedoheptulose 7-phosphate isomerase|nr:D-sedoheptulose 7-phosphate isomerase [Ktedonobacteraceae bacterium]